MAVQGNLPREQFAPVIAKGGDVAALLAALSTYIPTQTIGIVLDFFAYMAIASSFLGVTLTLQVIWHNRHHLATFYLLIL